MSTTFSDDVLLKAVNDTYSAKAQTGADSNYSKRVAQAFGYTPEQLQSIPSEAHMGLSCGNPVATASIQEGERVLDLGSGGGIDVFLAAMKTGPTGRAIGLDMSADMISRARKNASRQGYKPPEVAFVQCSLTEPLPINSESIDCILSNCVINLLPLSKKGELLKETYRVLKPGGRIVLDDIIAKKTLPTYIRNDLLSYIGCIGGAIGLEAYKQLLADANFQDVVFVDTKGDINVYAQTEPCVSGATTAIDSAQPCCGSRSGASNTPGCPEGPAKGVAEKEYDANEWVASYQIYAVKASSDISEGSSLPLEPLLRWWDAYPPALSSPSKISPGSLAALMRSPNEADRNLAVIDLRRDDHLGAQVVGSFNRPAQTFYDGLSAFHDEFGGKSKVVIYCSSSRGRAPRCAGWYQDYLNSIAQDGANAARSPPEVLVLDGGINGWLRSFSGMPDLVDTI